LKRVCWTWRRTHANTAHNVGDSGGASGLVVSDGLSPTQANTLDTIPDTKLTGATTGAMASETSDAVAGSTGIVETVGAAIVAADAELASAAAEFVTALIANWADGAVAAAAGDFGARTEVVSVESELSRCGVDVASGSEFPADSGDVSDAGLGAGSGAGDGVGSTVGTLTPASTSGDASAPSVELPTDDASGVVSSTAGCAPLPASSVLVSAPPELWTTPGSDAAEEPDDADDWEVPGPVTPAPADVASGDDGPAVDDEFGEMESVESEVELDSDGSAHAVPCPVVTATPTPRAIASAPTRPTYLAKADSTTRDGEGLSVRPLEGWEKKSVAD
jgi:hypothetical protein